VIHSPQLLFNESYCGYGTSIFWDPVYAIYYRFSDSKANLTLPWDPENVSLQYGTDVIKVVCNGTHKWSVTFTSSP